MAGCGRGCQSCEPVEVYELADQRPSERATQGAKEAAARRRNQEAMSRLDSTVVVEIVVFAAL